MQRSLGIAVAGILILGLGCAGKPRLAPPGDLAAVRWQQVDPDAAKTVRANLDSPIQRVVALESKPVKPKQILALSGGGMFGSFTAGVLNGWTKSGVRPDFDIVTGISTGGLIAPLAFAGPEYDDQMKLIYTRVSRRDIFTYRNWVSIPFRDAVASTAPLREIVDAAFNEDLILKIAAEHRKGRRLYLGTTNLDTRRFTAWDLGAIACHAESREKKTVAETKKLMVDLLIASCSLPGVFPPVPIEVEVDGKKYTELHMDGGVNSSVWVPASVLDAFAIDPTKPLNQQPNANLYVVLAGKPFPDGSQIEPKVFQVLAAFLTAAQAAQNRRDLANIYHHSKLVNVKFHMAAVPQDFPTMAGGLEFDRTEMNKLFEEGYRTGNGPYWWSTPPERSPGDVDPIRTGTKFQRAVSGEK